MSFFSQDISVAQNNYILSLNCSKKRTSFHKNIPNVAFWYNNIAILSIPHTKSKTIVFIWIDSAILQNIWVNIPQPIISSQPVPLVADNRFLFLIPNKYQLLHLAP